MYFFPDLRNGDTTMSTKIAADWRTELTLSRANALHRTHADNIRIQALPGDCWRVIDAAAAWDDPLMVLGFIERDASGLACTLLADIRRHAAAADLETARAFFIRACAGGGDDV
jgi:hypothetical protein